jgi:hypothetical protein
MSPIRAYLDNQPPSDHNAEVERIVHRSRMYHLIDGVLYWQGANGMMMKCIFREEDIQLLEDIHYGVCGSYTSLHSIVEKAFRHGFYWLTTKDDTMEVVKKCKDCQFFQKQTTKHVNPVRAIDISWAFAVWGIDIVDILVRAPGGFRCLFVEVPQMLLGPGA